MHMISNVNIFVTFSLLACTIFGADILEIYTISTSYGGLGRYSESIIPAQKIVITEINSRLDILPNIKLKLVETEDCWNNQAIALKNTVNIVKQDTNCARVYNNDNVTQNSDNVATSPIILGTPFSQFNIATAPVFEAYGYIQISSVSTSTALSNSPSFFRTMPNSAVEAKAYIPLCKHFGWDKIGIVYINDAAGVSLKSHIETEASKENITVKSHAISYVEGWQVSLSSAAQFIKGSQLYITIIIANSGDFEIILNQFEINGILQYPYYYIFEDYFPSVMKGSISIQPMYPSLISKEEYLQFGTYGGNETIYDISNNIYLQLTNKWKELYDINASMVYNREEPHNYAAWAYDSAYVLAYTLHDLVEHGIDLFDHNLNRTLMVRIMNDFLTKTLRFIGASGLVQFDENGDRMHGHFMYGYIDDIAEFKPFGVFGLNDNITIHINGTVISPSYFPPGTAPRSALFVETITISVDLGWYWGINAVFVMPLMLVSIACVIVICVERQNPIIAKSTYKLNIITCVGAILGLLNLALQITGKFGCVMNSYGWGVIITLSFTPAFARIYRLHTIMNRKDRNYTRIDLLDYEKKLIIGIIVMVLFDLILLFVALIVDPVTFDYVYGEEQELESTENMYQITQNRYQVCVARTMEVSSGLSAVVVIYKIIQFLFGLFFTAAILRNKMTYLLKYIDEIFMALLSIMISTVILVIMFIVYLWIGSDSENSTFRYSFYSLCVIFIIIAMMAGNVIPRLYILCYYQKHAVDKYRYAISPEEIILRHEEFEDESIDPEDEDEEHRQIDTTSLFSHNDSNHDRQIIIEQ